MKASLRAAGATILVLALAATIGCTTRVSSTPDPAVSNATISATTGARGLAAATSVPSPTTTCSVTPPLDALNPRQKIAQLLTVGVRSSEEARRAVNDFGVGGLFVGSDGAGGLLNSNTLPELRAESDYPLLIAIDEEGGRVSSIAQHAGPIPSARTMAATMSPEAVRELARKRGAALRAFGITVNFAPTLDVSDQPDNAVIGDRSFSSDPNVVITYGRSFAQGLLDSGVTPVFKHYPGHGRAIGDTHRGAVSTPPLDQLRTIDLKPFETLAGMPGTATMVGHLTVPGLTEPGRPASLSANTYSLLHQTVTANQPVRGPIFTDDLGAMRAISDSFPLPQAVLEALKAGADSPLWVSTDRLGEVLDTVERAVSDGSLPKERIDSSLTRMMDLRSRGNCGP